VGWRRRFGAWADGGLEALEHMVGQLADRGAKKQTVAIRILSPTRCLFSTTLTLTGARRCCIITTHEEEKAVNKRRKKFGELFKELRMATGVTLREFSSRHKLDAGNLSKLERGLLKPPQHREKLEEYAKALRLKNGSDEWFEFFDTAAADAGVIPDEVMSDAEVVDKLPLLFRTLRGQRISEDKIKELIRVIRGK
jgi:transcriptional regulator with XRE-family HTH domain